MQCSPDPAMQAGQFQMQCKPQQHSLQTQMWLCRGGHIWRRIIPRANAAQLESSSVQCSPAPRQCSLQTQAWLFRGGHVWRHLIPREGLVRRESQDPNVIPDPEDPSGGGAVEVPPRPWRGHIKLVDLLQIPFPLTLQDLANPSTAQRPCPRAPRAPHRAPLHAQ